jgi:hypothetical protein
MRTAHYATVPQFAGTNMSRQRQKLVASFFIMSAIFIALRFGWIEGSFSSFLKILGISLSALAIFVAIGWILMAITRNSSIEPLAIDEVERLVRGRGSIPVTNQVSISAESGDEIVPLFKLSDQVVIDYSDVATGHETHEFCTAEDTPSSGILKPGPLNSKDSSLEFEVTVPR